MSWRHQMETFSVLLALCARNSPITGEFPSQRPVTRSFDVLFDLHRNKRLSKQSRPRWFETPSRSLWRHSNVNVKRQNVSYFVDWTLCLTTWIMCHHCFGKTIMGIKVGSLYPLIWNIIARLTLQWRHNESDGVSNHLLFDCLLNRLFRRRYKKIKAPRHWPLWGEFTGDQLIPLAKGE